MCSGVAFSTFLLRKQFTKTAQDPKDPKTTPAPHLGKSMHASMWCTTFMRNHDHADYCGGGGVKLSDLLGVLCCVVAFLWLLQMPECSLEVEVEDLHQSRSADTAGEER